ncbi:hypothetical protein LRY65_05185 [Candidatus Woesebacteria bacterium]|nr:hypothetical protein [Candidatus Woesebacteria bacterium]MCD8506820.1 hypothetical protein [Candidatus Woesebacteria bacterium]MCD8527562.1 hypothetical protein [Candidatus Woesebacteria bacterium]MCD8546302.1 hypothetical protein [Candidatus Woesebacteria bacterium]
MSYEQEQKREISKDHLYYIAKMKRITREDFPVVGLVLAYVDTVASRGHMSCRLIGVLSQEISTITFQDVNFDFTNESDKQLLLGLNSAMFIYCHGYQPDVQLNPVFVTTLNGSEDFSGKYRNDNASTR